MNKIIKNQFSKNFIFLSCVSKIKPSFIKVVNFLKTKGKNILQNKIKKTFQNQTLKTKIRIISQLTFIYFCAIVDLTYSVLQNAIVFGYATGLLDPIMPILTFLYKIEFLKFWTASERTFFISYLIIEFMIVRSFLNLSKFIKFNLLLVFALLMIQGLIISYWDLILNREMISDILNLNNEQRLSNFADKPAAIVFFIGTFFAFLSIYIYLYFISLTGKYPRIPGLNWLIDSVAFWLRIKTPSMKFGNSNTKNKDKS